MRNSLILPQKIKRIDHSHTRNLYGRHNISIIEQNYIIMDESEREGFMFRNQNHYKKSALIIYQKNVVKIPVCCQLPVYSPEGYKNKKSPSAIVCIDIVVTDTLEAMDMKEVNKAGFRTKQDMLQRMCFDPSRKYKDLNSYSNVSAYSFMDFIVEYSPIHLKTVMDATKPFGEKR